MHIHTRCCNIIVHQAEGLKGTFDDVILIAMLKIVELGIRRPQHEKMIEIGVEDIQCQVTREATVGQQFENEPDRLFKLLVFFRIDRSGDLKQTGFAFHSEYGSGVREMVDLIGNVRLYNRRTKTFVTAIQWLGSAQMNFRRKDGCSMRAWPDDIAHDIS